MTITGSIWLLVWILLAAFSLQAAAAPRRASIATVSPRGETVVLSVNVSADSDGTCGSSVWRRTSISSIAARARHEHDWVTPILEQPWLAVGPGAQARRYPQHPLRSGSAAPVPRPLSLRVLPPHEAGALGPGTAGVAGGGGRTTAAAGGSR